MIKKYRVTQAVQNKRLGQPLLAVSVLNYDDRTKFASFVSLLVQIDKRTHLASKKARRTHPEEYAATKKTRSKRNIKEDSLDRLAHRESFLFYPHPVIFFKNEAQGSPQRLSSHVWGS